MIRSYLLVLLQKNGILNQDLSLNIKYNKRLLSHPALLQVVLDDTSFLVGKTDLKMRLHVLIQGIVVQPRCCTCGSVVTMRMSGRERFTFPLFCSNKCIANNPDVINKRRNSRNSTQK